MSILPRKKIPDDILKGSVIAQLAATYFSVGKRLERKTQCSATRGFILSALRDGVELNQNQIATSLGFDRTVVHRAVKLLSQERLVSEHRAKTGRAIQVRLTAKGKRYRAQLIEARKAADASACEQMTLEERETFLRLLKVIAECEF